MDWKNTRSKTEGRVKENDSRNNSIIIIIINKWGFVLPNNEFILN